jgi:hypothetical protein
MPLTVPVLDDRNFEQLLTDATARIPSFTPEWNNYGIDADPGITLIQLFAFLTDALLYRVNRYPNTNRLKFLQLLGTPLRPAASANGIIAISNDRGALVALPLEKGIQVGAGNIDFVTGGPVNVLPLEAQIYYKSKIDANDPNYQNYQTQYEAIQLAAEAASATDAGAGRAVAAGSSVQLVFYETKQMTAPTAANTAPVVDLVADTMDNALYLALLARPNVAPADVISVIASQTLSIGVVPAIAGAVPPLPPLQLSTRTTPSSSLIFEVPSNFGTDVGEAQYVALSPLTAPNVLDTIGVVQLPLPGAAGIGTWSFADPMSEGTEDFPPKIEDPNVSQRIVTWVRIRLPQPSGTNVTNVAPSAKLTWVGINAAPVYQAVSVINEFVGTANGEPDQTYTLANRPVLPSTMIVTTRDATGSLPVVRQWGQTDDLLAAGRNDMVYTVDPEAAQITFGDGMHGARPAAGARIIVNYQYGGGPQGNVGIGAISTSRDPRLQGGYSIENPVPTTGGDLGQTVDEAERNIPQVIRHKDRLVTAQDFADVAIQTPGVDINRVDVLPLFNPGPPPQDGVPGVVTLMVVPLTDPVNPLWPVADRLFLRRVCDYLDTRRLVTTELHVRGPDYVPVYVSVGIAVQAGYFPDLVRQAVTTGLRNHLSSLRGLGPVGGGWPLRKKLLSKDLEAAATRVDGVEYVDSLQLGVNSGTPVIEYDFVGLQLPRLDGLSVVEGTAQPLASVLGSVVQPPQPGVSIVPVPIIKTKC